jgi:hypothetical protein
MERGGPYVPVVPAVSGFPAKIRCDDNDINPVS